MKMMVRKEVFEHLKIPQELVHLKNRACKVSEREEEGELFFAAILTGENHTACGSVIQVRIQQGLSALSSEAMRGADMLSGDSKGKPQRLFLLYLGVVKFSFPLEGFPGSCQKALLPPPNPCWQHILSYSAEHGSLTVLILADNSPQLSGSIL